jgi:hypothetical protein
MLYEIINPSDKYTIDCESFAVALVCNILLSDGKYGFKPIDHDGDSIPINLFGDYPDEVYAAANAKNADELFSWARQNSDPIATALDSVRIGGKEARQDCKSTHDQKRSSINDIGRRAWKYAAMLRADELWKKEATA